MAFSMIKPFELTKTEEIDMNYEKGSVWVSGYILPENVVRYWEMEGVLTPIWIHLPNGTSRRLGDGVIARFEIRKADKGEYMLMSSIRLKM